MTTEREFEDRFVRTLITDVIRGLERVEQSGNMSDKRDLIRTALAAVEGLVGYYRDQVISIAADLDALSADERIALSELFTTVDSRGKVSQQVRHLPTKVMFRLVTNIATKVNPGLQIDFGDDGWERLQTAIDVRNRITHPKTIEDLIVNDENINVAVSAVSWVMTVVIKATGAAIASLKHDNDELRAVLEALKRKDPEITALYQAALRDIGD